MTKSKNKSKPERLFKLPDLSSKLAKKTSDSEKTSPSKTPALKRPKGVKLSGAPSPLSHPPLQRGSIDPQGKKRGDGDQPLISNIPIAPPPRRSQNADQVSPAAAESDPDSLPPMSFLGTETTQDNSESTSDQEEPKPSETALLLEDTTYTSFLVDDVDPTLEEIIGTRKRLDILAFLRTTMERARKLLPAKNTLLSWLQTIKVALFAPLFSESFKNKLLSSRLPPRLMPLADRAQRIHIAGALFGIVIGVVAIGLATSGAEKPSEPKTAAAPTHTESGRKVSVLATAKESETGKESEKKAIAFNAYPSFPWKDHLDELLGTLKKQKISDIYGTSPKTIATAMKKFTSWGPSGYDLLPNTRILEVYPGTKTDPLSPRFNFLFLGGKLFEIELQYSNSVPKDLDKDLFEPLLGEPVSEGQDASGKAFVTHLDGGILIQQSRKEDKYGRIFQSLAFSNKKAIASLGKKQKMRNDAMTAFAMGMDHFNAKKFDAAVAKFQEARKLVASFGEAYSLEAMAQLRKQNFKRADVLANAAITKTKNERVKARANGIRAVTHLYKGKKSTALAYWKAASRHDPSNATIATFRKELQTGKYNPERVAQTAARIDCLKKGGQSADSSIQKGLLARGNFPDENTFTKARELVQNDSAFQNSLKKWMKWECK